MNYDGVSNMKIHCIIIIFTINCHMFAIISHSGKAPKLLLQNLKKTPTKWQTLIANKHNRALVCEIFFIISSSTHHHLGNSLGANFKPKLSIRDSEPALPILKHLNVLSFKNLSPSVSDFWPSFLWVPWWVFMIWFGPCSSLPVLDLLFHGSLHLEGHFER